MTVDPNDFGCSGFRFKWGDHICAVFDDRDQQMEVMGQFVSIGLRASQRCVWVGRSASADRLRRALEDMGGDLATLDVSNQLVFISDVAFYMEGGMFEPQRTLDLIGTLLADGQRAGYGTMRVVNDVSWLRDQRLEAERWEQFEVQLTHDVSGLPLVMVCQYDKTQLSGEMIVAAFRTHPVVILGDTVHENPFYDASAVEQVRARDIL